MDGKALVRTIAICSVDRILRAHEVLCYLESHRGNGVIERVLYLGLKYFFAKGAAIVTGLGFTGYDASGRSKWDGASNVDIFRIEYPNNFKGLVDAWNIKTNIWLRECVYKRVTPAGKKPGFRSNMLTFFTSAFWVSNTG